MEKICLNHHKKGFLQKPFQWVSKAAEIRVIFA